MKISCIILSAGESRRMGTIKQLLPYGEKTVIEATIENYLQANLNEVIVVLGSFAKLIKERLISYPVKIAINERYIEGMLSSVQCGIMMANENSDAFMIGLCDQPFIASSIINSLIEQFQIQEKGIIIPSYNYKRGHPIIIHNKYVDYIFHLDQNIGLRQLIHNYSDDVFNLDISSDAIIRDMDFPEDYERELRELKK